MGQSRLEDGELLSDLVLQLNNLCLQLVLVVRSDGLVKAVNGHILSSRCRSHVFAEIQGISRRAFSLEVVIGATRIELTLDMRKSAV